MCRLLWWRSEEALRPKTPNVNTLDLNKGLFLYRSNKGVNYVRLFDVYFSENNYVFSVYFFIVPVTGPVWPRVWVEV